MQLARYVPIQRVEDIKQRGVVAVAVKPFFAGKRHHQVRFTLKTVDCGIGPAVNATARLQPAAPMPMILHDTPRAAPKSPRPQKTGEFKPGLSHG
ncbi:MAG: hypothetical protein PHT48_03590 [Dechloromonas sp.]|nr:hypothetical protein [Dechloromonas sp.]